MSSTSWSQRSAAEVCGAPGSGACPEPPGFTARAEAGALREMARGECAACRVPMVAARGVPLCRSCRDAAIAAVNGHVKALRGFIRELRKADRAEAPRLYEDAGDEVRRLKEKARRGGLRVRPEPEELEAKLDALWQEVQLRLQTEEEAAALADRRPLSAWVEESRRLAVEDDRKNLRRSERRGSPRHRAGVMATVVASGTLMQLVDISTTGALLVGRYPCSLGTPIRVAVGAPGVRPVLAGTVRRVRMAGNAEYSLGVQFDSPLRGVVLYVGSLAGQGS